MIKLLLELILLPITLPLKILEKSVKLSVSMIAFLMIIAVAAAGVLAIPMAIIHAIKFVFTNYWHYILGALGVLFLLWIIVIAVQQDKQQKATQGQKNQKKQKNQKQNNIKQPDNTGRSSSVKKEKPPIYLQIWFIIAMFVIGFFGVIATTYSLILWPIDIVLIILRVRWSTKSKADANYAEIAEQNKSLQKKIKELQSTPAPAPESEQQDLQSLFAEIELKQTEFEGLKAELQAQIDSKEAELQSLNSKQEEIQQLNSHSNENEQNGISTGSSVRAAETANQNECIQSPQEHDDGKDKNNNNEDPLLQDAIEIVVSSGKASASMLQHRLNIGYARAERIMHQMEECGIVSPMNGSEPRRVFITKDDWEEIQRKCKTPSDLCDPISGRTVPLNLTPDEWMEIQRKYANVSGNTVPLNYNYTQDEIRENSEPRKSTEQDKIMERIKMYNSKFDYMEGHDFEYFCADLLRKNGFNNVEVTKGSKDQGIDILAYKDGVRYGIQCKCYTNDIGNSAVQQAFAGKSFYDCHVAAVLTNRHFTPSAKALAESVGVLLWDRDRLNQLCNASEN